MLCLHRAWSVVDQVSCLAQTQEAEAMAMQEFQYSVLKAILEAMASQHPVRSMALSQEMQGNLEARVAHLEALLVFEQHLHLEKLEEESSERDQKTDHRGSPG